MGDIISMLGSSMMVGPVQGEPTELIETFESGVIPVQDTHNTRDFSNTISPSQIQSTSEQTTDHPSAMSTNSIKKSLELSILEKLMDHLEKESPIEKSKSIDSLSLASSVFDKLVEKLEKGGPSASDISLDGTICRICYGTQEEHLFSICHCKGSIAYVHLECIERWLQECGVDTCDLCKYKFITVRKPTQSKLKSLLTWFTHEDNTEDMEELLSDFAATFLFSPFLILLTVSGYQAIVTNTVSIFHADANEKFVFSLAGILSTLSLCTLLSVVNSIGVSWLCYIGQKHYARWHAWYRKLTTVRIVLPDTNAEVSR